MDPAVIDAVAAALKAQPGWAGLDPYLEDPATLWLLHWQIASNLGRATTWFWTFSHFNEPGISEHKRSRGHNHANDTSSMPTHSSPSCCINNLWWPRTRL